MVPTATEFSPVSSQSSIVQTFIVPERESDGEKVRDAGADRAHPATRRCRSRTRRDTRGCRSRTPPCTQPSHGQIWQPTAATSLPPPPFWHQVPMAAPCTCSLSSTYGFPAVRSSSSLLRQGFRSLSSVLFACITRCAVTCADGDVAELCGDLFYASTMDACIA